MTSSQASKGDGAGKPALAPSRNQADELLRTILVETLSLDPELVADFDADTGLFGHLPELDSMAVATLLTEIEDRFGFFIEDDDIDAEMLENYGALFAFVEAKLITG